MNRDQLPAHVRESLEEDCDFLLVILRRVIALAPALDVRVAAQIEEEMRATYGGLRVRIPKRGKHLSMQEREEVYRDGLTAMPTEEILRKHKISRATLFRTMKGGGRFEK